MKLPPTVLPLVLIGLLFAGTTATADEVIVVADHEPISPECLSATIFPNPINETSKAIISNYCSTDPIYYSIQDISGKTLERGEMMPIGNQVELNINSFPIVAGTYILHLQQSDVVRRFKMMKVD